MFLKLVSHEKRQHSVIYCIEIDSNIIMSNRTKLITTNIKKFLMRKNIRMIYLKMILFLSVQNAE